MMIFRNVMIFLQFAVIFLLLNPVLLIPLGLPVDTYEMQRVLQWGLIGLSLLHLSVDKPVRLRGFGFLQSLCVYKKVLLVLILVLGLISCFHAIYPEYALLQFTTFLGLFCCIIVFTGLFGVEKDRYLEYFYAFIVLTFAVSCASALLMLFYDVTQPGFHNAAGDIYTTLASPGYMNRRFYDDVVCMVLPILVGLSYRQGQQSRFHGLIFLMLAYLYTRGMVSHSRIYIFEPLVLLILFPLLYRRKAWLFLGVQFAAIAVGVLIYLLFYMHHGVTPAHFPDRTFLNNRALLWSIAFHLILQHPFLGVGPLHFNWYAQSIETYAAHPHSAMLVIGAEWGVLVLLALVILIGSGMWACFKNRACMPLPLMGSLVGVFLMAQVDGLILMPPGQTMLCLILAWAFACHTRGISEVNQKVIPNWFGLLFLGLGGLSFAVMLWVGLPLLMQMNLIMLNFFSHCNDSCMLSPNYWSQGFIAYY